MQTITWLSSDAFSDKPMGEDGDFPSHAQKACAVCQFLEIYCIYVYAVPQNGWFPFLSPFVFPNPLPNKTSRAFHGVNHEDCNPYDGHQFFIFGNGNGITSAQCTASWAPWKNPEVKEEWRNAVMRFLATKTDTENISVFFLDPY